MTKRLLIVVTAAVALLVLAAPAMAFNGYRADYSVASSCQGCHTNGTFGAPIVYPAWAGTGHAVAGAEGQANRLPYGSVCQGCHTSNFAPSKVVPTPTATSTSGSVSWGAANGMPTEPQSLGSAASSENYVGCSSCHYGAEPVSELDGRDANDTAHAAPYGNLADAQICGACHSRYAYTKDTYAVAPIPTPTASQTTLIQPQMAIGYPMLGSPSPSPAWSPNLADYLIVPSPGWTPLPDPAATSAGLGLLQTYWQIDGKDSPWQQTGHDGSAAQYPEWASEGLPAGHADALTKLKDVMGPNPPATCLECHSADYRIAVEAGKTPPTGAQAKYGITCVGCHTPHDAGAAKGRWDEAFSAQLIGDPANPSDLCTTCHNGEIPAGSTASPGSEVHHPMKEMMDGYGAIDVAAFPSVHKGKCVQCHMPPTSLSRGSVQLGGNHTFNIITPADATDASPIPYATATASVATATPTPSGTPVITTTLTVTQDSMPFSACSTCHNKVSQIKKNPVPVATTTATPTPGASPLRVTVSVYQNANETAVGNMTGGDKALWLQDTIDQRQSWTKAKITEIHTELDKAAVALGYADTAAAQTALVAIPQNQWTTAQRAFLSGFTNVGYVESEGSFGLHNWDYSREIVNKAMEQAKIAQTGVVVKLPWVVTLALSKTSVKVGTSVTFSGTVRTAKGVAGAGTVQIWRRLSGVGNTWKLWRSVTLNASGQYSTKTNVSTKGTSYWRTTMPADAANLAGSSTPNIKLVVN